MRVVWLASYPRSGVTFLRHVIEQVTGLPTWAVYKEDSGITGGLIASERYWTPDVPEECPVYFVKTHLSTHAATALPAIHLIRDGRDAALSFAHYLRTFGGETRALAEIVNDIIGGGHRYGHWGAHTLAWAAHPIPPTARMTYETLIADPIPVVCDAIEAVAPDLSVNRAASVLTFEALHARKPTFFRVGTSDQWHKGMSDEQQTAFIAGHGLALQWFENRNTPQAAVAACS